MDFESMATGVFRPVLSLSCFPLLRSLAESYLWRKGTSKKMFVQKNRRVKVPQLKAEFTRNEDMCNNFQIVLTDTIFFYWLETVFSKRDHAGEIRGDKKLKQCIDGSFLTAKNEKAVPSQGKQGVDLRPETLRAGMESMTANPVITKLELSISG